jgi:hypothetical protein
MSQHALIAVPGLTGGVGLPKQPELKYQALEPNTLINRINKLKGQLSRVQKRLSKSPNFCRERGLQRARESLEIAISRAELVCGKKEIA